MTERRIFDFAEAWKWVGGLEPGPRLISAALVDQILVEARTPLVCLDVNAVDMVNWVAWRVIDLAQQPEPGATEWEVKASAAIAALAPLLRASDARPPLLLMIKNLVEYAENYSKALRVSRRDRKRGAPIQWRRQDASLYVSKLYRCLTGRDPADTIEGPFHRFVQQFAGNLADVLQVLPDPSLASFCQEIAEQKPEFWHTRRFASRAEAVAYLKECDIIPTSVPSY